jgi:hypothetical protein
MIPLWVAVTTAAVTFIGGFVLGCKFGYKEALVEYDLDEDN